jgi:Periplasmic copper-binding protein (NosD)
MAKLRILTLIAGAALVAVSTRPANAGVVVGTCTPGTQFSTIQAAVNAAPAGSTIQVCPGGYPEQVVIEKTVSLQGIIKAGLEGSIILPPVGGFVPNDTINNVAQVLVKNTSGVNLTNLIVDAANNTVTCSDPMLTGIVYHNASGTVNKLTVRNQSVSGGCYSEGLAAIVDNQQAQAVTVENSDFRNIGGAMIDAEGQGLTANATNNFIAGPAGFGLAAYGFFYDKNAKGSITGNTVTDLVLPVTQVGHPLQASIGIAVSCTSGLAISGNTVSNTQGGIVAACLTSGSGGLGGHTITGNKVFNTQIYDGILMYGDGNTITNNTIVASGESGIHFDATYGGGSNNTASGNTITEACAGVLSSGAVTGNKLSANTYNSVYSPTQKAASCGPIL